MRKPVKIGLVMGAAAAELVTLGYAIGLDKSNCQRELMGARYFDTASRAESEAATIPGRVCVTATDDGHWAVYLCDE